MQLRTDGVHYCRKSAGTGPVVLKVVPVTGAAFFAGLTVDQLTRASLFPHLHYYWYVVGSSVCVCVCIVCVVIPFILDVRLVDVPAGVTQ